MSSVVSDVIKWSFKLVILSLKCFIKLHVFPDLFKSFVAAYTVGEVTELYNQQQYDKSYSKLKPIANYNIDSPYLGKCLYMLAIHYINGFGVDESMTRARMYLEKAATQGSDEAILLLAELKEKTKK